MSHRLEDADLIQNLRGLFGGNGTISSVADDLDDDSANRVLVNEGGKEDVSLLPVAINTNTFLLAPAKQMTELCFRGHMASLPTLFPLTQVPL